MSNNRVLDFATYHRLNEAETSGAISAVDQIIDLFYQSYAAIVTKIGKYPDAIKDLTEVAESKDKGKAMMAAIDKIATKVDPKYKEAGTAIQVAGRKLKEAFETLLNTEEGKKEAEGINDKIYKKIIAQIDTLKSVASEAPKLDKKEKAVNDSEEFNGEELGHLYLFEKNTFSDEREDLIKKITPIYSQVVYLGKNSPVQDLKAECLNLAKELKGYYDLLSNEKEWESMKRRERKDKLEEILGKVNDVPTRLNDIQSKTLVKLGIDSKVQGAIKSAMDLVNKAIETLNKTEEVQIVDKAGEDKKEDAKKEEGKKDEKNYEEIKSGNVDKVNLTKKGKNLETIKNTQEKLNQFLADKEKIKADGLYGKGTEEAVKKVASKFSTIIPEFKDLDGKSMTPQFLKFLDKYEENKDKIAGLFK